MPSNRFNQRAAASAAAWAAGGTFIDMSEVNMLSADLGDLPVEKVDQIKPVVAATGVRVVRDGKLAAPVDTGFLRSSIGMDLDDDGLGVEVGPSASYGGYVETGTSRMAPHAYMGPALDRNSGPFMQAIDQIAGDL